MKKTRRNALGAWMAGSARGLLPPPRVPTEEIYVPHSIGSRCAHCCSALRGVWREFLASFIGDPECDRVFVVIPHVVFPRANDPALLQCGVHGRGHNAV